MQFEGDLLTYSPGKYFTIYKMIGSDIKTLIIDLGARTVHGLPFHLSTHLTISSVSKLNLSINSKIFCQCSLRDFPQILLLILSEFRRINFYTHWNHLKTYLKVSRWFQGGVYLIHLNSLNISSEIWRRSPNLQIEFINYKILVLQSPL